MCVWGGQGIPGKALRRSAERAAPPFPPSPHSLQAPRALRHPPWALWLQTLPVSGPAPVLRSALSHTSKCTRLLSLQARAWFSKLI